MHTRREFIWSVGNIFHLNPAIFVENIFHRFLASRLFICFLEVSFSESTKSSARSIQLFCLSTTAALPALATSWAHQDGLVQHWQPRSWMASCVKSADCYDFTKIQIFTWSSPCSLSSEFFWFFWPRSSFAIAVLQVTNLGKTFLKKGRGISVLRFAQLWDCVSFEIHSVFGDLLSFWDCLSFDIVSVKIFSQFWNCLSFDIVSVLKLSQFWVLI